MKFILTMTLVAVLAPAGLMAQDDAKVQDAAAKIAQEQEQLSKIRADRNQKIADLQSQLMELETERANDMAATGARVVGETAMAAPIMHEPLPMAVAVPDNGFYVSPLMPPDAPPILMQVYGPPTVVVKFCTRAKCRR